jgi:hypothetical protein
MNFGLSVAAGAFFTSTPFDIVGGGSERILVHVRCHLVRYLVLYTCRLRHSAITVGDHHQQRLPSLRSYQWRTLLIPLFPTKVLNIQRRCLVGGHCSPE